MPFHLIGVVPPYINLPVFTICLFLVLSFLCFSNLPRAPPRSINIRYSFLFSPPPAAGDLFSIFHPSIVYFVPSLVFLFICHVFRCLPSSFIPTPLSSTRCQPNHSVLVRFLHLPLILVIRGIRLICFPPSSDFLGYSLNIFRLPRSRFLPGD